MILVTGGTGFVGHHVVHALRGEDRSVRALVRDPSSDRARTLANWGCELVQGDVTDAESLRRAVDGCEAVMHFVALIAEPRPEPFERIMKQGTRDLVAAAKDAGVRRFVLQSALGTDERSKDLVPYYGAKWDMEQTVKGSGLEHVIFRPSFIFGKDGGILPMFIRQVRLAPVTPVAGDGERRLQPIWVDDVARFFARAVDNEAPVGQTFDLGGPDQITWNDLLARLRRVLGVRRRPTIHIPMGVMRAGAAVIERLPRPPVTRDQLTMLADADNVGDARPANETFGIEPIGVDEQLRRAAE
jgi:uncharacterized protein YbjT (DUF2867 family)